MRLIKKLSPYVLTLGIGVTALTGCAGTGNKYLTPINKETQEYYPTIEEAAKVLKVPSYLVWINLPDGYKTTQFLSLRVKILAGIAEGTIKVKRIPRGYEIDGFYSRNLECLRKILKEVDLNKDKIITKREVSNLEAKLYREKAE